jgi:hypothetical protein
LETGREKGKKKKNDKNGGAGKEAGRNEEHALSRRSGSRGRKMERCPVPRGVTPRERLRRSMADRPDHWDDGGREHCGRVRKKRAKQRPPSRAGPVWRDEDNGWTMTVLSKCGEEVRNKCDWR